jgi:hypothetical protein
MLMMGSMADFTISYTPDKRALHRPSKLESGER